MKGHKAHHHRKAKADGGEAHGDAATGSKEYEEDLSDKPARYNMSKVENEAEERKAGGRTKKKMVGSVHGLAAKHNAGRKPRKSGGRAGSDMNPFSSARSGTPPKYHKDTQID